MPIGGPWPLGPCHDDFRPLRARHSLEKSCRIAQQNLSDQTVCKDKEVASSYRPTDATTGDQPVFVTLSVLDVTLKLVRGGPWPFLSVFAPARTTTPVARDDNTDANRRFDVALAWKPLLSDFRHDSAAFSQCRPSSARQVRCAQHRMYPSLILNIHARYRVLQGGNTQADYCLPTGWWVGMRFTHGMEDWGQEHPLSHKKINSSSACDHWTRFDCRIVLAEVSSLFFVGTAFFQNQRKPAVQGIVATYVLGGLPPP